MEIKKKANQFLTEEEKIEIAKNPNLKDLERILNDNLSDSHKEMIDEHVALRFWIYDAMEEYSKFKNKL